MNEIITLPKSGICNLSKGMAKNEYSDVFGERCPNEGNAPSFLVNNIEGAYQAVKHLIYLGHRKIAIITALPNVSGSVERLEGYRRALQEAGLILNENLIKQGNSQADDGFRITLELLALPKPPTGIFVTNYLMTIGIMKALHSQNVRHPKDMAIIGFDDFEWVICFSPVSKELSRVLRIRPKAKVSKD